MSKHQSRKRKAGARSSGRGASPQSEPAAIEWAAFARAIAKTYAGEQPAGTVIVVFGREDHLDNDEDPAQEILWAGYLEVLPRPGDLVKLFDVFGGSDGERRPFRVVRLTWDLGPPVSVAIDVEPQAQA
jgi:hypothetical protein